MDNHPDVVSCPEADILVLLFLKNPEKKIPKSDYTKVTDILLNNVQFKYWSLGVSEIETALSMDSNIEIFIKMLELYKNTIKPSANTILFKAVELIRYAEGIFSSMQNRKIQLTYLSLIRDPREIFASQKITYVENKKKIMNDNPLRTAIQWKFLIAESTRLLKEYDLRILKYEDMIKTQGSTLYEVLGMTNEGRVNDDGHIFYRRISDSEKPMHNNILNRGILSLENHFKLITENERNTIEQVCTKGMIAYGYHNRHTNRSIKYLIYFVIKYSDLCVFHLKRYMVYLLRGKYFFKNQ